MLSKLKFAQKIWLLPSLAAIALGGVLVAVALLGRSNTRALQQIQAGYYPAVELRHALQGDLAAVQRGLQDAVAASDADGLRETDSLADIFRRTLAGGRDNPVIPAAELGAVGAQFETYYMTARGTSDRMIRQDTASSMVAALEQIRSGYADLRDRLDSGTARNRLAI